MVDTRVVATVEVEVELDSNYGGKWTFEAAKEDARRELANRLEVLKRENEDLRVVRLVAVKAVVLEERS